MDCWKRPKNVPMPISGLANKLLGVANASRVFSRGIAAPVESLAIYSGVSIPD